MRIWEPMPRVATLLMLALVGTGCRGTITRFVPYSGAAPTRHAVVPEAQVVERSADALRAEGYAQVGWIYRRGGSTSDAKAVDHLARLAAARGGERIALLHARKTKVATSMRVCFGPGLGCATEYTGEPGTRNVSVAGIWVHDPAAAAVQSAEAARKDQGVDPRVRDLRQACADTDFGACTELALIHIEGVRARRDPVLAYDLAVRACVGGHRAGCRTGAYLHYSGAVIAAQQDPEPLLERLCQDGDSAGCEELELLQAKLRKTPKDISTAAAIAQARCARGDPMQCKLASRFQRKLGDAAAAKQAWSRRHTLLEAACAAGRPRSCVRLRRDISRRTEPRRHAAISQKIAEAWQGLCNKGLAHACVEWGLSRERIGQAARVEVFEGACTQGSGRGCVIAARRHADTRNLDLAQRLYFKACRLNVAGGCEGFERTTQ